MQKYKDEDNIDSRITPNENWSRIKC
jgi:hypothetical protein